LTNKKLEDQISALSPMKKRIISLDEILISGMETDDTNESEVCNSGKSSLGKSGRKKRKVK